MSLTLLSFFLDTTRTPGYDAAVMYHHSKNGTVSVLSLPQLCAVLPFDTQYSIYKHDGLH